MSDSDRRADQTTAGGLPPGIRNEELVPDLTGGTVDRYHIVREIGRGGMGVVYEARDKKLKRTVAIKVLPARSIGAGGRERFLREAQAAAALNHANIVAIHDAGEADGRPFLVMEFVPGHSLHDRPPSSLDEALAIARQVCEALEHAHERGIVHRDLKPANILVFSDGEQIVAKLTDMGIALARGAARVTLTGAITGTPTFMAPEQALGRELDGRADLYSFGVMLYLWAAGRPPFDGDDALAIVSQHIHAPVVPPRTYRPNLPEGLEPIVMRLLTKSPEGRFASAGELRQALESVGKQRATPSSSQRVAIEGLARGRMVGRRDELAKLQELWRAASDGRSHLALISGEPGVGKTRLAREVTATAQLDGALALAGGCYENEATTPYLPFVEAFRRLVHEMNDSDLAATLGDTAAEIARLAPEIDSRLGPFPERPSLSPQEERLRLFDSVARYTGALSQRRGLLFFIDDLQWADHGSLALLHYLLRQLATERVLFLGTYREIELDRAHALSKKLVDWNRERLATRLRLDRLCRGDTARMVATLLGQDEVPAEIVDSLHHETEGNPFFVEEIVKALIAEGDLVHEGCSWKRRATGEFVLPQSVKSAIGSRLERVSDSCGEILRTAAVLGKLFDFAELASVARRQEDEVLDALDEAVTAQLIVAGRGESFAFTHDKIREVLYEELNPIRRRRLHARIAEGLERLQQRDASVAVEDLAHHFVQSGDFEKGLLYACRSADAARSVFAWDEALSMLAQARDCADALERTEQVLRIDEAIGDAAHASGNLALSAEHYERAIAAAADPLHRNLLRSKAGEVYAVSGDRRGLEHVRRALQELDAGSHPAETAFAMMVEARFLHVAGQLERAIEIYRPTIDLAESVGDAAFLVRLYSYVSGTYQHLAEFEESDAMALRCVEIGDRENLAEGLMLGHEFLCENAFYRGRWRESIDHGEKNETVALEVRASERYGWSQLRGYSLLGLGRLAGAERLFRCGLEAGRRTGDLRLELFMEMGIAVAMLDTGRTAEAVKEAERAARAADEAKLMAHRVVGSGYLTYALIRVGRFDEAASEARRAVELITTHGAKGTALIHGATLAEGLVCGGTLEEARAALDHHLELARSTCAEQRLGENLRVRALLAAREGRTDEGLSHVEQAVVKFEACSSPLDLARALALRAHLSRDNRPDAAEVDLGRARALLDGCGAEDGILAAAVLPQ